MMKIIAVMISLPVCIALPCLGRTADVPQGAACEAIMLRTSQGWWLRVNADGGGAYGFGVLMDRIEVREGSFDFKRIYEQVKTASVEQRVNAEAPYVTASCFTTGRGSARELYLPDEAPIVKLFQTARENRKKPQNEREKQQHRKIDLFWEKSPLLLNTPDAGVVQ